LLKSSIKIIRAHRKQYIYILVGPKYIYKLYSVVYLQKRTKQFFMTLFFILPSQHLPNQRFSRKILTTFTYNKVQKPNSYTVYCIQYTVLFTIACVVLVYFLIWCKAIFDKFLLDDISLNL